MENYKAYRKRCIVKEIKENNKDVAKDIAIMAAGAVSIGVGILGVVFFGRKCIDYHNVGEIFSFETEFLSDLYAMPVSLSLFPVLFGCKVIFDKKNSLIDNIRHGKSLKKRLKKIENDNEINYCI